MLQIRKTLTALLALLLLAGAPLAARAAAKPDPTAIIAELIRPQKLATLGERGANPRALNYFPAFTV